MKFETKLPPETIKQRLTIFTLPFDASYGMYEDQFLAKWNTDDTFYLLKMGGSLPFPFTFSRFILPFVGKIEVRDSATYIVGKFDLFKSTKVALNCFLGLGWILVLFGCLLNSKFDLFGKISATCGTALFTIIGYALFLYFPGSKKQQSDVIEFIQNHLLY